MKERLQKILASRGLCSRRKAEEIITAGRVAVNGSVANLGDSADMDLDTILVDGKPLPSLDTYVYILLHKPKGYLSAVSDARGRRCVSGLVADCGQRVYPVGRLDMFSEGLLLLTNDGALANRLMHPKGTVRKIYHVWVSGFYPEAMKILSSSIEIDGRKTIPAKVRVLKERDGVAMLEFVLQEGRNRQIRRLCETASVTTTRLKRVQEGGLSLGDLPVGKWRVLTDQEIRILEE